MKMSSRNYAEVFNVSPRRVRQLWAEGVIPRSTGNVTQEQVLETIKKFLEYKDSDAARQNLIAERVRLLKVRADHAALKLKREREGLLDTACAQATWGPVMRYVHHTGAKLPAKWAKAVYGKSMPEIRVILEKFVDETLRDWADPSLKKVAKFITADDIKAIENAAERRKGWGLTEADKRPNRG